MDSQFKDIINVPLSELYVDNEFNSRGQVVPMDVIDLAKSIEHDGLQTPITVQPWTIKTNDKIKYRVVAGHRRTIAFKVLKRESIPAILRLDLDDLAARKFNIIENLHRKNLNIKQEAHALVAFTKAGWSENEIAEQFNQSRGWVKVRLMLLSLPDDIQDVAAAGLITQEHIKMLYGKPKDQMYDFVREVKEAKARGEKIVIEKPVRDVNPHVKRQRNRAEIFEMISQLYDITGMALHTRALAWAAGEISEYEFMKSVEEYCHENELDYVVPNEMLAARFV